MLGAAIRESNRVRSLSISITISSLGSVEVGVGVVISNSVGVSVRRWLIRVGRGMVSRGSMVDWGSMVSRSMSKHSLGSMKTVRRISNSSNSCAESLGLDGAPVLPLVWLGHGLVGHLASWA